MLFFPENKVSEQIVYKKNKKETANAINPNNDQSSL